VRILALLAAFLLRPAVRRVAPRLGRRRLPL